MSINRLCMVAALFALLSGCGDGGREADSTRMQPLSLDTGDYTEVVQHLYVAYYGRPADPAGLAFWAEHLARGNAPNTLRAFAAAYGNNTAVKAVVDNFGRSEESVALYGVDNAAIVRAIYRNLFNREPDTEGLRFYADGLSRAQITNAQAALSVINGAQGTDAHVVSEKVAVATAFTAQLSADQTAHYSGLEANAAVRARLQQVGIGTDVADASGDLMASIDPPPSAYYYREQVGAFPDLAELFESLCGISTLVQTALAVDLNGDGRKDLVLDAWCDLNGRGLSHLMGTPYDGAIPNTLILLLQQPDGTFTLANKQLFGTDLISLSGPGLLTAGDLNHDGIIDVVVAPSKEDGRNPTHFADGSNNYMAPTQVLLSRTDGSFAISEVGPPTPGGSRFILKDEQGLDVMAFNGEVYRHADGAWISRSDSTLGTPQAIFAMNGSSYAVSEMVEPQGDGTSFSFGLKLAKKNADLSWSRADAYTIAPMTRAPTVNLVGSTLEVTQQFLVRIGQTDWLIPSIAAGCVLDTGRYVGLFEGIPLSQPYSPGQTLSFNELLQHYTSRFVFVDLQDGKFSGEPQFSEYTIPNEFALSCQDINRDGLADIVVTRWGQGSVVPYIYTAKSGQYMPIQTDRMPAPPHAYHGVTSYVTDMNNDGLADIIYYPLLGMRSGYAGPITLKMYRGIKPND